MRELIVYLQQQRVGVLNHLPYDRMVFQFDDAYLAQTRPAVLSQCFFNKLYQIRPYTRITQTKAPPFFANLLPEGSLRSYLATQANINEQRDFELLTLLGQDLPGAVQLLPNDAAPTLSPAPNDPTSPTILPSAPLRFSLAGVQLKFSALQSARGGLTIPASGMGGDWIVKMPSMQFANVPENEFAMLSLAAAIGIDVPPIALVRLNTIQGLPSIAANFTGNALAIKRFDRAQGQRIHIEDFAQVFDQYPHKKYEGVSYQNIAQMLVNAINTEAALAWFKRLIFTLLIGNGDMHLKNWSLIYRDPTKADLAPAYDFVATHLYLPNERLALNFVGEKNMLAINLDQIKRFADKSHLPTEQAINITQTTIAQTIDAWQRLNANFPLDKAAKQRLSQHMQQIAKTLQS